MFNYAAGLLGYPNGPLRNWSGPLLQKLSTHLLLHCRLCLLGDQNIIGMFLVWDRALRNRLTSCSFRAVIAVCSFRTSVFCPGTPCKCRPHSPLKRTISQVGWKWEGFSYHRLKSLISLQHTPSNPTLRCDRSWSINVISALSPFWTLKTWSLSIRWGDGLLLNC